MSTVSLKRKSSGLITKYIRYFENPMSILSAARKGLKPDAVFDFMTLSGFPPTTIEKLLNKSIRTFNNYRDNETSLDPTTSEKLLRLFSLYQRGSIVFGSVEEFSKWIAEPAFGLGNHTPQNLLDTITGILLVDEELARIEYGDIG
jgi:putative toxin-antitoxin system antitoxin component (TIGR02293 family)